MFDTFCLNNLQDPSILYCIWTKKVIYFTFLSIIFLNSVDNFLRLCYHISVMSLCEHSKLAVKLEIDFGTPPCE